MLAVALQGISMIAESGKNDSTPVANFNGAGAGDASDAGVKSSTNVWDQEW